MGSSDYLRKRSVIAIPLILFMRIYFCFSGFNPADVAAGKYGQSLHFWDWSKRKLIKTIDLGADGLIPLETRFCHNPTTPLGFVVCALGSSVFRYFQDEAKEWQVEKVIQIEPIIGKDGQPVPAVISDMLISLNDKFSTNLPEVL